MRVSVVLLAVAAVVLCLVGSAMSAPPVIYSNNVSGNQFTLPTGYAGTFYDAQFSTKSHLVQQFVNAPTTALSSVAPTPMSASTITITVQWAGDAQDTYNLVVPKGLTVTPAAGSAEQCSPTQQTVLSAQVPQCAYTLSWDQPFAGTFSLVYINNVGGETITMTFVDE